ncbi:FkbM family methyltransferase [Alkalilimnicola ehrlichii]|uniref:FkbM family methyltransferase n=1 Tax=Alkalilimnicola ehrlichii TaxID=351052 RepID=UPI0015F28320|nr:FkbM family methyltransferase [Alkalilimnicola ehrlichii]
MLPISLEGQRLLVPLQYGVGEQNLVVGPKDVALYRVLQHVIPRTPGAVVDVGCNVGHFMELCVLVDRNRRYVGVDVSTACVSYVEAFIRANALQAHQVFPLGLSDRPGIQRVFTNSPFDVCASLSANTYLPGTLGTGGVVIVDTGDAFLDRLGLTGVALIKIDVEGLELSVLKGLRETVDRERPYLIFEILVYAHLAQRAGNEAQKKHVMERRKEAALGLERFCREQDYVVYRMLSNGDLEYRRELDPGDSTDLMAMDHLALPREKAADLLAGYGYRIDMRPDQAAA